MFSVLVIRLRSLRLLRVSGIVMRLRMFLLLITFLKADRKSGSAGMPRPISYAVFCLKKKRKDALRQRPARPGLSRILSGNRRTTVRPRGPRKARFLYNQKAAA